MALAVGGEAGSRLCRRLAFPTSGDTLLRRSRASPPATAPTPRVLGVDDFAFRKGHTYGTILVDLERGRVIDLLPDRTAATLTAWLKGHPGVQVISRDRASAYSQAATAAAPNAVQVADRFHLLVNLREAVERTLQPQTAAIRKLAATRSPSPETPPPHATENATPVEGTDRRQELFDRVRRLHREGVSLRRIARELELHYRTVERYVRSDSCPDWNAGQPRASQWDRHAEWIRDRLRDGCSTAQIHRDLAERGLPGGVTVVSQYVRRLRAEMGLAAARPSRPLDASAPAPPTARRLSVAVVRRPDRRTEDEQTWVTRLKELDAEVRIALDLAEEFAGWVRNRQASGLKEWLSRADAIPSLRSFAKGLRRDEAAVRAGLSLVWSNGPVEGAVNRLKLLKRSGYGRARFDLLRARVLNGD